MLISTVFLFLFPSVQIDVLARTLEIKITVFGSLKVYFLQSIVQYQGFSDTSLFSNYCIKTMHGLIGELLKRGKWGELAYALQKLVCC